MSYMKTVLPYQLVGNLYSYSTHRLYLIEIISTHVNDRDVHTYITYNNLVNECSEISVHMLLVVNSFQVSLPMPSA